MTTAHLATVVQVNCTETIDHDLDLIYLNPNLAQRDPLKELHSSADIQSRKRKIGHARYTPSPPLQHDEQQEVIPGLIIPERLIS